MGNSVSIRNVRTEDLNGGTWTLHLVNNLEKMKPSERIKQPIDLGSADMGGMSDAGFLLQAKYISETGFSDPKFATLVYILDEMREQLDELQAFRNSVKGQLL